MVTERTLVSGEVRKSFEVKLEEAELTLRFVECILERERPPGMTALEVLEEVEDGDDELRAMVADMRACAKVACHYFAETIAGGMVPEGASMTMEPIEPSERTRQ